MRCTPHGASHGGSGGETLHARGDDVRCLYVPVGRYGIGQEIPTFAQSEVGCTLDPGHDPGCFEYLRIMFYCVVWFALSDSSVYKSRPDSPAPLHMPACRALAVRNTRDFTVHVIGVADE